MNKENIEEMYDFKPEDLTNFLNENSDKLFMTANDLLGDKGIEDWFDSVNFEPSYVGGDLSVSDVEIDQPIGDMEINRQLSPMVMTDENKENAELIPVFRDNEKNELLTLKQAAEKIENQLESETEYMEAVSPIAYSSYRENEDDGYEYRTADVEYDLVPEMKAQFESMQEFFQEQVKEMQKEQKPPQLENKEQDKK